MHSSRGLAHQGDSSNCGGGGGGGARGVTEGGGGGSLSICSYRTLDWTRAVSPGSGLSSSLPPAVAPSRAAQRCPDPSSAETPSAHLRQTIYSRG